MLQSPTAVILEPKKITSDTVSIVSPSIHHEVMGPDAMILVFSMLSFKLTFPLFSFTFIRRLFRFFTSRATETCRPEPSEIIKQIWKSSDSSPRRREGESASRVATLYYLKCQVFKKSYKTQKTTTHILE